jgi:hypothetical protein
MHGDMSASLGDASACGCLGAAQDAQLSTYVVYWTKTDGSNYLVPSPVTVTVNDNTETVTVMSAVNCALGGRSVPIMVSLSALPHTGIEVSLAAVTVADDAETNPSAGITADSTVLTLTADNDSGVLGFACAADAETLGNTLNYVLAGTDAASFSLSSATVTVTGVEALAAVSNPDLTITAAPSTDVSGPQLTTVTGLCPGLGEGWLAVSPVVVDPYATADATAAVSTIFATVEEVQAAYP